jgi:hypothetical protein
MPKYGDGKDQSDDPGRAAKADGVDARQCHKERYRAKELKAQPTIARIGIEDEIYQEKHKQEKESSAGRFVSLFLGQRCWLTGHPKPLRLDSPIES